MSVESNRLGQETSPYLLQHQHNPVHWQAWTAETLALAKQTGKPILLSSGYAACHWCHVMAHESFEDPDIAALMNESFINVKVDREERPDVDYLYQQALMMMGQRGGWPLTMFLTPEGQPFWGGTYFPPFAQGGRSGFAEVLKTIAELWRTRANAIEHNVAELSAGLASLSETTPGEPVSPDLVESICAQLEQRLDHVNGGFGAAPKFPQATSLDFLWRAWKRTGRDSLRQAVVLTLDHISQGGVYDHLGGGFARYSTDNRWLVPHFEKMLYDNAQLIELLTEVWQDERRELYRLRVTETIEWMTREMRAPGGGFASSLDADSDGEEGKFYSWSQTEIRDALGARAPVFERAYGVSREGNWEHGKSVLNRLGSIELLDEEAEAALARDRAALFLKRERRVRPGCDDKVLADWNGLTIAAIAKAACVFERRDWLDIAIEAFDFVKSAMTTDDGRLLHSWRCGRARHMAVLDDYGAMCRAALALYEATGAPSYLECGRRWVEHMEHHYRDRNGGYFYAANDADTLIARVKIAEDSALPSGNGMMLQVLAQLYYLTGESVYRERAEANAKDFAGTIRERVLGFSSLLNGVEMLREALQIVVIGETGAADTAALKRVIYGVSRPGRVLSIIAPGAALPRANPAFGKTLLGDRATAYVCRGMVCSLPIVEPDALAAALREM
ncbi:thioredoxin domain-containing protein [Methylocystis sp. FS]|uniref:thioredoxin domain-containing protein n=1 Tax=Methylocystis silviterrae TaxID=2743612 RepID=UPI0015836EA4|nr:thioredoxin domain-containing protein [Methylocystis silviterrae]NUJ80131.1 thioredoxin domain-containing protein [Methylocystis silviterrae]